MASAKQSRKNQHVAMRRRWRKDGTYERLAELQDWRCGICGNPPKHAGLGGAVLDIDHCHRTDRVRGLLCRGCNLRLGRESDPMWLRAAAAYLEAAA